MCLPLLVFLVGRCPAKQEVPGLIPGQGTGLDCEFGPWLGCIQETADRCFPLTPMFLSLSFSLPSLSKNK